jgi:hypothetical protein
MGRGYFNPSIKRIKPSSVAYNNSVKKNIKKTLSKKNHEVRKKIQ